MIHFRLPIKKFINQALRSDYYQLKVGSHSQFPDSIITDDEILKNNMMNKNVLICKNTESLPLHPLMACGSYRQLHASSDKH